MVKWGPVIVGFILAIILGNIGVYINPYWGSNLGLFIAGLIVGYWVHEGLLGGLWNATVAGAFGSILLAILLIVGGTIFGGLAGFAATFVAGVGIIIVALILNIVFMGVGGAIGGLISGSD
ncbi:MAG: DUF5518 domain-containing protein [Methanobacteriaceae archaeon]|jgi:hypothetical protein|nr:MAG: hypothetical protein CIT01_04220 [Methanobacterium sp. BRmetb2]MCC7557731.1 DUF5518 domain-containing protein [Methanobacteriaceae archaeon]